MLFDNSLTAPLLKRLRPSQKPERLYHYTSCSGLLGILTSRSLWATDIRFLNDSSEYAHALGLTRQIIESRIEQVRSRYDESLYRVLIEALEQASFRNAYVVSFSENQDQLSQWRAYCPPTGGCSIGFSYAGLLRHLSNSGDSFLTRCVYGQKEQEQIVIEIVSAIEEHAEVLRGQGANQDRVCRESYKFFEALLPMLAPSLKHASFAEEMEWRLVSLSTSFSGGPLHFRMGRSLLVPYYSLSLEGLGSLAIEDIVVGPTPHPELASTSTKCLLNTHGLQNLVVRISEIPYRSW